MSVARIRVRVRFRVQCRMRKGFWIEFGFGFYVKDSIKLMFRFMIRCG